MNESKTVKADLSKLQFIKGIGPQRAAALNKEGIFEPAGLLFYFPRGYIDRNTITTIRALAVKLRQENLFEDDAENNSYFLRSEITVVGKVIDIKDHRFGKNRKMAKITVSDTSGGKADLIFWSYSDYYINNFHIGDLLSVSGSPEVNNFSGRVIFNQPELERLDENDEQLYSSGQIIPVYRITQALKSAHFNSRQLRGIIHRIIDEEINRLEEILPDYILEYFKLPDLKSSVKSLHFPESPEEIEKSKRRMKFSEIFMFELNVALRRRGIKMSEHSVVIQQKSPRARTLYESLPFELTGDQKKVLREISEDMKSGKPMNRLLQGDVGSGKTIVAILTMLVAIDSGFQTAFMAPTELLAEQHYSSLMSYLEDTGINIIQLVGGQRAKMRRNILSSIASGEANIIVGTHAMFESEIQYNKLGFVVIDEQHRFGVAQRATLKVLAEKSFDEKGISPHILVMSATPIPRTLSMTVYGDLDVSIINEMPKNRKPIKTSVVFESQLEACYKFIRKQIGEGRQVFIVYPLVEKSEKLELKAATEHYERLSKEVFPDLKCGLLHGQMFWYEKDETMKAFLNKGYNILVATTVIEVGIDIPNATVMLIENAERFGLSQLHQLRGRVGRSDIQSHCILVTHDKYRKYFMRGSSSDLEEKAAVLRLKTMQDTTDGFRIAEVDLKLRGPGDVLGTQQSGLPPFKFIDLARDGDIITSARKSAFSIIERDPHLRAVENQSLRKELVKQIKGGSNYFDIA